MTRLSIELERPNAIYYAGEVVRGTVKLQCRHDAPPSAELNAGDYSYIRYKVRAYIDLANWRDPFCKQTITVIPNRPIPMPLLIQPHVEAVESTPLYSSCCRIGKTGVATIKFETSRIAYAPGESVDLGRSTILYEGIKKDTKAQVVLMGPTLPWLAGLAGCTYATQGFH